MSSSPLKKTKSKLKFYNINARKESNKENTIKTIIDIYTSKNGNNKNKKEINDKRKFIIK